MKLSIVLPILLIGLLCSCNPLMELDFFTENIKSSASVESIFVQDTCRPPCWFGLTPGKSAREDMVELFENRPDLFAVPYPDTLTNDWIEFLWVRAIWNAEKMPYPTLVNRIHVENNVVTQIDISVPTDITLAKILDIYGQPDVIDEFHDLFIMIGLFYSEQNMSVGFLVPEDCNLQTLGQDFYVDFVGYYSPETYEEILSSRRFIIPNDVWLRWQTEKEDKTCLSALIEESVEVAQD